MFWPQSFYAVLHHCTRRKNHRMRKPKLVDLEFMMLMFLIGGALVHGLLMGLFTLGRGP
jgi:hypothetical protein